jgi:hypothetical protein
MYYKFLSIIESKTQDVILLYNLYNHPNNLKDSAQLSWDPIYALLKIKLRFYENT